jgi:heme iron utilization protein
MAHLSALTQQLRTLLQSQRVASLGTIGQDGAALVSMVPYAVEPQLGWFVIHVSGLAGHTRNLETRPRVSLMVMRSEIAGEPVHDLPRVTFDGTASIPERDSAPWQACRAAYLARFPEAEPMTQLGDFRFVAIEMARARQVAGFGAARTIGVQELRLALTQH